MSVPKIQIDNGKPSVKYVPVDLNDVSILVDRIGIQEPEVKSFQEYTLHCPGRGFSITRSLKILLGKATETEKEDERYRSHKFTIKDIPFNQDKERALINPQIVDCPTCGRNIKVISYYEKNKKGIEEAHIHPFVQTIGKKRLPPIQIKPVYENENQN